MQLGYVMYKSGLVRRRMAPLGLSGGPLAFVGGMAVLFGALEQPSAGLFVMTALKIAWELSLTIYLIFKGFKPSPILSGEYRRGGLGPDIRGTRPQADIRSCR